MLKFQPAGGGTQIKMQPHTAGDLATLMCLRVGLPIKLDAPAPLEHVEPRRVQLDDLAADCERLALSRHRSRPPPVRREWNARTRLLAGKVSPQSRNQGKSRVTAALQEHLQDDSHMRLRHFCSLPHEDSALRPVIGQRERAAGFARDDTAEEKLAKLETLLAQSNAPPDEIGFIAELLSIPNRGRYSVPEWSPQKRQEKTLTAPLAQLERLAACVYCCPCISSSLIGQLFEPRQALRARLELDQVKGRARVAAVRAFACRQPKPNAMPRRLWSDNVHIALTLAAPSVRGTMSGKADPFGKIDIPQAGPERRGYCPAFTTGVR
jgi:hypothetical protein